MNPAALLRKAAVWLAVTAVLIGVFTMYTQPEFMVDLAQQLWACF